MNNRKSLHTTRVVFGKGVVGSVTHGKGIAQSIEPGPPLVDRICCKHEGNNIIPRKTAFRTRILVNSEHLICQSSCLNGCK